MEVNKITTEGNLSYLYMAERESIPILGYVTIDEHNWGRLDKIVLEYYNDMVYYPFFLDFNNITDVSQLSIGQVLDIPDILFMLQNAECVSLLDDDSDENNIIPGVCKSSNNKITNEELKTKNYNKNNTKTTANSKLNITQQTVFYDQLTGMVKF